MSSEDIIAIIKWGPLLFFLLVFLFAMIIGLIKGRRKSLKSAIYSFIYLILVYFLTPVIANLLMDISINDMTIEMRIEEIITNNDTIKNMVDEIPGIESILKSYPSAFISLFLFVVFVIIKPLLFPLYIVYSIIYNLIQKHVFKYSKYKRDENGKIMKNEKGKKIKEKHPKYRLTGGLIKGVECTLLSSMLLVPVGVITRLYKEGANASINKDLSTIEGLDKFKDYMSYLDAFNDSFIGKATNSIINEKAGGYLTKVEINGEKTTLEKELSNFVIAAVYLEESGLIKVLSNNLDLKTLDLSLLNIDKIDAAIEMLFESVTLKSIVADGVNYVLSNNLEENLIKLTEDGDIVDKIKYSNDKEVKNELLTVTKLIRDIVNSKLLVSYQNNSDNVIGVVNEVSLEDMQVLLNRVLSIKILSRSMPSLVTKLLKDAGLRETLKEEDNNEFVTLLLDVVKFVKTLDINHLDDITKGNVMDNLIACLYKEGAIKENSMDAFATFLSRATSSRIFDDVLVSQLNLLLENFEITLNSQMIVNVKSKQDWKNELLVLEDIFTLYNGYKENETVDFLVAKELIADLKNTKAMILSFPIAYQKLFPLIGIEVDASKIKYIDYSDDSANQDEIEFYSYWKQQLLHLDVISGELANLEIASISDISFNLLEEDRNIDSLATIVSEVFISDLLKDGVTEKLDELLSDLLKEYEITLNEDAIANVNNLVNTIPYYIVDNSEEVDVELIDGKYYIDSEQVSIEDGEVVYKGNHYALMNNSLKRIWKNELTNLSIIVKAIKTADYTSKENLTKILNAVDNMYLLKDVKKDLLIFAVKQINIIDVSNIDKDTISFTKEKEILLNVIDKYDLLKDIPTMDFKTIDDNTIEDLSYVLENVLESNLFGDYAADNIVSLSNQAGIELDRETVLEANTWETDLKLIRTASNMNDDSFNKETLESLLNGIENSSLLCESKNQLLIDTINKVNIEGVNIPDGLTGDDIVYADEKNAILVASDNLTLLESMSKEDFSLTSVDSDKISELLATLLKSKMFGDSVVDTLVGVFEDNSIKHDLDTTDNTNLINSIKSVDTKENWKKEIDLIKNLLAIDTKEEVTKDLFDSIEDTNNTKLLSGCRANLLLRMIKEIDRVQPEAGLNSEITVSYLVNGGTYDNYKVERDVLISLVELEGISGIDSINASTKDKFAGMLNNMKDSTVFASTYNDIVSDIVDSMATNDDLTDWGLNVDNTPDISDWNDELTALLLVKENAPEINEMTLSDVDPTLIGKTLDELDKSKIISGSESAANNIVKKLSGNEVTITKLPNQTWQEAFEAKFNK